MGSESSPVKMAPLANQNNQPFEEVQVVFTVYYKPAAWQSGALSLLAKLNGKEVLRLGVK